MRGGGRALALVFALSTQESAVADVVLDDFTVAQGPFSQFIQVPDAGAYQTNGIGDPSLPGGARHTVLSISDRIDEPNVGIHQTIGGGVFELRSDTGIILSTPETRYSGDVNNVNAKSLGFDAYALLPGADAFAVDVLEARNIERFYIFADFDQTLNYGFFNRFDDFPEVTTPTTFYFRFDEFGSNGPWSEGSVIDFGAATVLGFRADLGSDSLIRLGGLRLVDIDPNQPVPTPLPALLLVFVGGVAQAICGRKNVGDRRSKRQ